ncbi:DUF815 domain-containing protein [Acidithiobacillus ferriphilus]|uniref:DUF815 domain-containing protein n=1 Tax=Acidithiobacillus ferriphilus TaxID=1689834 RepID=UPI0027E0C361|nr:DUF815 domain-containing protein [Acidithiobacillus ferriphilus]
MHYPSATSGDADAAGGIAGGKALRWALQHGSRSGRVARQFARHWAGSNAIAALQ